MDIIVIIDPSHMRRQNLAGEETLANLTVVEYHIYIYIFKYNYQKEKSSMVKIGGNDRLKAIIICHLTY